MALVRSVNVGIPRPVKAKDGLSGIDKRPVSEPVLVTVPRGKDSGLAGDAILDRRHHGGPDQAVYAYAREDLDDWAARLGRPLADGVFGENLTTTGIDVNAAVVGELWHVGASLVLQVTTPRVPCATFRTWLDEPRWEKRFTEAGLPGTYLRVMTPGFVQAGDAIVVSDVPAHGLTARTYFAAVTLRPDLLGDLVDNPDVLPSTRENARRRLG